MLNSVLKKKSLMLPDWYHEKVSDHNFWSLNINRDWRPKDITDFYHIIIGWCNRSKNVEAFHDEVE